MDLVRVCDGLSPLPVEEKAIVGCLRFAFSRLGLLTGFSFRDPGLWPWGFQGAEMVNLWNRFFARDRFP